MLSIINQALGIWGQLLQKLLLSFLDCLLQIRGWFPGQVVVGCWSKFILIYVLAIVHFYIQSLQTKGYGAIPSSASQPVPHPDCSDEPQKD